MKSARWLLLTHQIPSEPSNLRVKIWRRLQSVGAVAIKSSIYVLPNLAGTREDFEWLRKEIVQMKGDASVFLADNLTDMDQKQIVASFREARAKDFSSLIDSVQRVVEQANSVLSGGHVKPESLERIEKLWSTQKVEWERLQRIDFFGASNRGKAAAAVKAAESIVHKAKDLSVPDAPPPPSVVTLKSLKDRTWVTRESLHVDRIATAWLVRRFIDPAARFKFVKEPYKPKARELRFDMEEGEFTHFGDWCSFETVLHRTGISDQGLQAIAEIVHDLDLKDRKFSRTEAIGLGAVIRGMCKLNDRDEKRLEAGYPVFDALYATFRAEDGR